MEPKRELTKGLIASSLKELMLTQQFEKITIRMITERAGIIRPTFYYHFQDKYEVLEWIVRNDILNAMRPYMQAGKSEAALRTAFAIIQEDRQFYTRAFEVTGQNSFNELMTKQVEIFLLEIIDDGRIVPNEHAPLLNKHNLAALTAASLVSGIFIWLKRMPSSTGTDDAADTCKFLLSHSFRELIKG